MGVLLERQGKRRQSAKVFRDVMKIMPLQDQQNSSFREAVAHAKRVIQENQAELERHLESVVADLRGKHAGEKLDRFDESLQVLVGNRKRYSPEPVMFHFAQLPPLQFYDEALFPWMGRLELQTEAIKAELLNVLAESREEFRPYIQVPQGAPVNQWAELNYSPRWSAYFLWQDGTRVEEHCNKCPNTVAALDAVPLASTPNFSDGDVLHAGAAHHHPAACGRDQFTTHRPLATDHPARLLVPGWQRDSLLANGQGIRLRRFG
jgi:aspartate beta-hydroxylase